MTCILCAIGAIFGPDTRRVFGFGLMKGELRTVGGTDVGRSERGKRNLFSVGRAQDLAPLGNCSMLLENHDCDRSTSHERHQAVEKRFSFVLLIKLRRFVRRQSDDTLSENSET